MQLYMLEKRLLIIIHITGGWSSAITFLYLFGHYKYVCVRFLRGISGQPKQLLLKLLFKLKLFLKLLLY